MALAVLPLLRAITNKKSISLVMTKMKTKVIMDVCMTSRFTEDKFQFLLSTGGNFTFFSMTFLRVFFHMSVFSV
jgi:hypothetical protein